MPVVVFSSFTERNSATALKALELGAVEVLEKPTKEKFGPLMYRLAQVLKETSKAKPRRRRMAEMGLKKSIFQGKPSQFMVALGASTGGTDAIAEILRALPADHPGLVVVQHMPAFFTGPFADRLDKQCAIRVREAKEGDVIEDGLALIAPGDRHLVVDWAEGAFRVSCPLGPLVNHCRPSVDVLFHSVARSAGPHAVGAILTGMGHDGAGGLLAMREAGAPTLAQDEATSVVYGMPKEAVARGAVDEIVPIHLMARAIQNKIEYMTVRRGRRE
jgi:two-component system chemotaxis response regulator CheB